MLDNTFSAATMFETMSDFYCVNHKISYLATCLVHLEVENSIAITCHCSK